MRLSVFTRTLRNQGRSLVAWAVGLVALASTYVALYPSIGGNSSITDVLDKMPKAYKALFTTGGGLDFTSAVGYLDTELFTFMGPLLMLVFAISAGAGAVAGEEEGHTLDLLLANPVSRTRLVIEKFAALASGAMLLMLVLWVVLVAEGRPAGMDLSLAHTAAALLHLGLLATELGAIALLAGAVSGRVAVSRAAAALVAVSAYLVNAFAPLVSWLRPLRKVSPFYQYVGHDPLRAGVSWAGVGVTVLSTAAILAVAAWTFGRRDVQG